MQGLEQVLAAELKAIGATDIELETRAVSFMGDQKALYRANLELRTALRVLAPLATFKARNEEQFYLQMQEIDWTQIMDVSNTLAVSATTNSEIFTHSKFIALKAKDAIVDQFRALIRRRPNVQLLQPHFKIHLYINHDKCQVYLDSSGESLHKRGYRVENHKAPINEVLAAGMIKLSGWQADSIFIDPMCGSGTILAEAAMMANNIAPQINREYFSFKYWRDYNDTLWQDVWQNAKAAERPFKHPILGFDVAFQAIRMAQRNLDRAGVLHQIKLKRKDFERHTPPVVDKGVVIINPPYGERIETDYEINGFYAMIGDHLKDAYSNYDVWIISSNMSALKCIGLKPAHKHVLFNGPLECKFQCYSIFRGSLKDKRRAEAAQNG